MKTNKCTLSSYQHTPVLFIVPTNLVIAYNEPLPDYPKLNGIPQYHDESPAAQQFPPVSTISRQRIRTTENATEM